MVTITLYQIRSDQLLSRVWLFATPWIAARQASLSNTNSRSSLRLTSIESVMPSSHLILLSSPSPLAPNPSQHLSLFQWVNSLHEVAKVLEFSALASFLPKKSQGWSPSEWTGWFYLQSRDSQESSPTPQFKSINSSALSLFHSPTLTSIHDHRKNHSLD